VEKVLNPIPQSGIYKLIIAMTINILFPEIARQAALPAGKLPFIFCKRLLCCWCWAVYLYTMWGK